MTLEDFFTLTEMKDGLTAPARVKELVNVMQKEKDCIVKNVGDATRQWSTVASTIAATEDKDCLDLFVHLDGLWFIDRWLNDALKFSKESSDSFVDESITALLRALEKLHIGYEKSMSCGIWMTVKNLLGHNSFRVQDRARALFDYWKHDGDSEIVPKDVEKVVNLAEGVQTECSSTGDIALSGEQGNEEKYGEPTRDEMKKPSSYSDVSQPEKVDDVVQTQTSEKGKTLDNEFVKDECPSDPVGSIFVSKPVKESLSIMEEVPPLCHLEGTTLIETCTSAVPKQDIEAKLDIPDSNEYTDKGKQKQVTVVEISSVALLGDTAASVQESVAEPDIGNNVDSEGNGHSKVSPIGDITDKSAEESGMDGAGSPHHCRNMAAFRNQGQDCNTDVLLEKREDPYTSSSSEDSGTFDRVEEYASDGSDDKENDSNFLKSAVIARDLDVVRKNMSDFELDSSMVDALEVARQVAIEVEREVVDRGDASCSSSEKISEGGIRQTENPDSICGKENQLSEATSIEVLTGPNLSADPSPRGKEELLRSPKNLDDEAENCAQDIDSIQVIEAARPPEFNAEKGLGDFDLNQEIFSEDMDHPVNPISSPISVVSASRAAAARGLPEAPLQFEGAHGWKGSAATSAFRPASPRRILEDDKILTAEGSNNSSKQRHDFLDIDLNVAEASDDNKVVDLIPGKQIPVSSGLPFGESSIEASSRRPERLLRLDLNRLSDDGDGPSSDWRMEGRLFHNRNGHHHSPSPSSSSSSFQPSLRNIDLNDQPSFYNDSLLPYLGKSSSQNLNTSSGVRKSDDSAISIMGTRVEVNRKFLVPQTPSLPNGRILEPTLDVNLASGGILGMGSALPYNTHPPVFGYNGLTTGPTVTFSSAMFGPTYPIPYMVDSRGTPLVPQIVGAAASASLAAYSQPSFITSMIEAPLGSNGAGPSRPNFDLNSGFMIEEGNKESSGGLRQFFSTGQSRSINEHLRANSLLPFSVSGSVGKRKEPDSGWESYPVSYKHHQPPWK
ncbi:hypothetical protein U1Q18_005994 [Sarracenia purpurea var. burkii]